MTPCAGWRSCGCRSGSASRSKTIKDALAELPEERTPTRDDWARLSGAWRRELDDRIEQLQRLRDDLTDCIGCGCLSLDRCALANPYDRLGEEGPGARRIDTHVRPPAPRCR